LCLQAETDDNCGENVASDISNKSRDVASCGAPSVEQVSNFMSDDFLT